MPVNATAPPLALGQSWIGADLPGTGRMAESERVHAAFRADILDARLRPGMPVSEQEGAARFAVSRTPVREAILRLAREGLVYVRPQKGTYVSLISLRCLEERLFVRQAVESRVLERVAMRADRAALAAALDAILTAQIAAAAAGDFRGVVDADSRFHYALVEASGLTGVWNVVAQARDMDQRIRSIAVPDPGRIAVSICEHQAIAEAVRTGVPERARELMEAHLARNLQVARAIAERCPACFEPNDGAA